MSHRLRRRLGGAKASREALLDAALRDWKSGRAYLQNGNFRLRPIGLVAGVPAFLSARGKRVAPWNKVAKEEWGNYGTWGVSEGIADAARAKYGAGSAQLRNKLLDEMWEEGER